MSVDWIKMKVAMFEDEKIRLIENLPEGDAILVIWMKLLAQAGKTNDNGYVYFREGIPYTDQMLSVIFGRSQPVINLALTTFKQFGMIETDEKGIRIVNWEKHQNVDGLDRIKKQNKERVQRYRERKKQEALGLPPPTDDDCNVTGNVTVTQSNAPEEERELEKEKDINKGRKQNVYDDDSTYMKMAQYLKDQILSWKPNAKIPNDLNKWDDEFRKMVEVDNRTQEEIKDVIDFATTDSFWKANILSASSLRSKFDQLQGQLMTRNKKVTPLPNRNEPSRGNVTQQSIPNVADELRRMEEMKRKCKAKEA